MGLYFIQGEHYIDEKLRYCHKTVMKRMVISYLSATIVSHWNGGPLVRDFPVPT